MRYKYKTFLLTKTHLIISDFRDALPIFFHHGSASSLSVDYLPLGNLSLLVVVTDVRGGTRDVMDEETLVVSVSIYC